MQFLPVILTIILAAAATIAVLFWRIKPQSAADTEAFNKRMSEENQKLQALQAKLDARETALRTAETNAAAAKATMEAAVSRASASDQKSEYAKAECTALQAKLNQVQPLVATANAEKAAAETAQVDMSQRYATAITKNNTLQAKLNEIEPSVAKANAEKVSAETAKQSLEGRLDGQTQKYDGLLTEYKQALGQASTAKADVDNARTNMADMAHAIESLQSSLTNERALLAGALAKQLSDEAATHQFKNISQAILKETIEQAKQAVTELTATFQKSSGVELEKHAEKVARTLEPLQLKLHAYDEAIESMKKGSQEAYGGLSHQITELQKAERSLHDQAKALTTALSATPKMRGNYGELALKRLVEHAGMEEKCHFESQASRDTEEGRKIPDVVVHLPGGQKLVVDAKAVVNACAEAYEANEEIQRNLLLKKHCENVRSRISELSAKSYFTNHTDAVESVVLFLPAENLYMAAMENDPELTDYAASRKVIICGPSMLIMLLTVANQLWRRASIEKEAQDIKACGEDIYKAACGFVEKFVGIGKKIQQLENEYNGAVGTLEGRLLPAGKRMSKFESVSRNTVLEDVDLVKDNVRDVKEGTKQLIASMKRLPGLTTGEYETAEIVFGSGETQ